MKWGWVGIVFLASSSFAADFTSYFNDTPWKKFHPYDPRMHAPAQLDHTVTPFGELEDEFGMRFLVWQAEAPTAYREIALSMIFEAVGQAQLPLYPIVSLPSLGVTTPHLGNHRLVIQPRAEIKNTPNVFPKLMHAIQYALLDYAQVENKEKRGVCAGRPTISLSTLLAQTPEVRTHLVRFLVWPALNQDEQKTILDFVIKQQPLDLEAQSWLSLARESQDSRWIPILSSWRSALNPSSTSVSAGLRSALDELNRPSRTQVPLPFCGALMKTATETPPPP